MRRVCMLTSVHPAFDVRIFLKECKSLARGGYEVTLIVPHEKDDVVDGVRIKAVPKPKGRLARMTRTVWQVYRESVRLNTDVYHFHDPELIAAALILRAMGKKVVYDIHEDVPGSILSKYYVPLSVRQPLSWLAERVENIACRRFSALVAATPAIADRFKALNANTVVIQNFPLPSELSPSAKIAWSQRPCSIAYVGYIDEDRGIREMVEAMGLLPDSLPVTLKLAGSFSPERLRDKVAQLPGWKKVDELGFLDRAGVSQLLAHVRAGLVLFHPEPNHVAAQPNKLFEYMSAGIPVIASDFPLWRQIIKGAGCGLLVDPMDAKAIAKAIEYILTHPQEAEAMGRRGREAVEKHYNWATEERKLVELYETLVRDGLR